MTREQIDEKTAPGEDGVLDQVVRESRTDLRPAKIDWSRIEGSLLARVEKERAHEESLARFRGSRAWGAMAGLAALAAAFALFAGRGSRPSADAPASGAGVQVEQAPLASSSDGVSTIAAKLGKGEVRVGAAGATKVAATGRIGRGGVAETADARVVWEAGRATWLLEEDSRVTVKAEAPLILALERGAVEAQVQPVPNGEAFAVDVGELRVAVHGTHLRVAREAGHVTVDLSEGVVSIGRPPRTGSTYGTLVVAPAHVELELGDVAGSLVVTHEIGFVRPAVTFGALLASSDVVAPPAPSTPVTVPAGTVQPATHPLSALAGGGPAQARPGHATQAPSAPAVDPQAQETIAAAVRMCAADAPHSSEVKVTVSSTLELTVGDDGFVRAARFNPPLAPEIQSCASNAIYKTRFADAGVRTIDLVLTR